MKLGCGFCKIGALAANIITQLSDTTATIASSNMAPYPIAFASVSRRNCLLVVPDAISA